MANAILWQTSWTSRGTVLTTELNSLGDNAYSAVGSPVDNTSNLDQYGAVEVNLASLNPTTGAFLTLFLVQSVDGTNYEDAPSSTQPGYHQQIAVLPLATGSATKRVSSPIFKIPPGKFKFVLRNDANVALGSSGNTVTLYTANDELQ